MSHEELAEIQDICRDRATLILDEFYGGYNYTTDCDGSTISGAENVVDVNQDGPFPPRSSLTAARIANSIYRRAAD